MSFSNLTQAQIEEMLNMGSEESSPNIKKAQFSPLESVEIPSENANINYLDDICVDVKAVLGSTCKTLREILDLEVDSVIALNKLAGDKVDVYVNDEWLGLGEVLVLNDQFGVRVSLLNNSEEQLTHKE